MNESTKERVRELLHRLKEKLKDRKMILLLLAVGVVLLVLPSGGNEKAASSASEREEIVFDLKDEEKRLADILSRVSGAGRVSVMLTLKSGTERVIAVDTERSDSREGEKTESETSSKTVIVSEGSSKDGAVTVKYIYPEYMGAIIVAEGADRAAVRLALSEAASAVTGLGSSKIKVIKMK